MIDILISDHILAESSSGPSSAQILTAMIDYLNTFIIFKGKTVSGCMGHKYRKDCNFVHI